MRMVLIIIFIDIFIFTLVAIFSDNELKVRNSADKNFRMDRYGYSWRVAD